MLLLALVAEVGSDAEADDEKWHEDGCGCLPWADGFVGSGKGGVDLCDARICFGGICSSRDGLAGGRCGVSGGDYGACGKGGEERGITGSDDGKLETL